MSTPPPNTGLEAPDYPRLPSDTGADIPPISPLNPDNPLSDRVAPIYPPLGQAPPVDINRPPVDINRPPVDINRPPVDINRPPVDINRPFDQQPLGEVAPVMPPLRNPASEDNPDMRSLGNITGEGADPLPPLQTTPLDAPMLPALGNPVSEESPTPPVPIEALPPVPIEALPPVSLSGDVFPGVETPSPQTDHEMVGQEAKAPYEAESDAFITPPIKPEQDLPLSHQEDMYPIQPESDEPKPDAMPFERQDKDCVCPPAPPCREPPIYTKIIPREHSSVILMDEGHDEGIDKDVDEEVDDDYYEELPMEGQKKRKRKKGKQSKSILSRRKPNKRKKQSKTKEQLKKKLKGQLKSIRKELSKLGRGRNQKRRSNKSKKPKKRRSKSKPKSILDKIWSN